MTQILSLIDINLFSKTKFVSEAEVHNLNN